MRPSSASVASTSAEKCAISAGHLLLALRARLGIAAHRAIELFVIAHGVLEHSDRARERADFVVALAERHRDRRIAAGDRLGDARDFGDRPGHAARNHRRAGGRERDGKPASRLSHNAVLSMPVSISPKTRVGALGIDSGEFFEIFVERFAHRAIGVVVAPFAAGGGATSVPSRASSLRKSMNWAMRSENLTNSSASSPLTDFFQSSTTWRSVR